MNFNYLCFINWDRTSVRSICFMELPHLIRIFRNGHKRQEILVLMARIVLQFLSHCTAICETIIQPNKNFKIIAGCVFTLIVFVLYLENISTLMTKLFLKELLNEDDYSEIDEYIDQISLLFIGQMIK